MKLNKPYTNKDYADLAVYCNRNALIIEDKGDYLEAVNPPEPAQEEKEQAARNERNMKLTFTDWTQLPDAPLTTEKKAAYAEYRQALRDLPGQDGFPDNIVWPVIQEKEENTENVEEPASEQIDQTA